MDVLVEIVTFMRDILVCQLERVKIKVIGSYVRDLIVICRDGRVMFLFKAIFVTLFSSHKVLSEFKKLLLEQKNY